MKPPRAWVERLYNVDALDALRGAAATSPRWRSRRRWSTTSAPSSGRCASVPRFTRHAVCSPLTLASRDRARRAARRRQRRRRGDRHQPGARRRVSAHVRRRRRSPGDGVARRHARRTELERPPAGGGDAARGRRAAARRRARRPFPARRPAGWRWRIGSRTPAARRHSPSPRSVSRATGVERAPGLARLTAWSADLLRADPEAARIFLRRRSVATARAGGDARLARRLLPRPGGARGAARPSRRRISRRIARNG